MWKLGHLVCNVPLLVEFFYSNFFLKIKFVQIKYLFKLIESGNQINLLSNFVYVSLLCQFCSNPG